jgi:hypothetical protein
MEEPAEHALAAITAISSSKGPSMARHEAYPPMRFDLDTARDVCEEFREADDRPVSDGPAVGVQFCRDVTRGRRRRRGRQTRREFPASAGYFPAPNVRHDAVEQKLLQPFMIGT